MSETQGRGAGGSSRVVRCAELSWPIGVEEVGWMRWIRPDSWGLLDTNVHLSCQHRINWLPVTMVTAEEGDWRTDGRPDSCERSVACPG